MSPNEVDLRIWRTQLSPHGRDPGDGWELSIDGTPVASTPEVLSNGQAHDWARSEMGEGVRFEPVVADEYAEKALREGRAMDWVANPEQGPRRRREPVEVER